MTVVAARRFCLGKQVTSTIEISTESPMAACILRGCLVLTISRSLLSHRFCQTRYCRLGREYRWLAMLAFWFEIWVMPTLMPPCPFLSPRVSMKPLGGGRVLFIPPPPANCDENDVAGLFQRILVQKTFDMYSNTRWCCILPLNNTTLAYYPYNKKWSSTIEKS